MSREKKHSCAQTRRGTRVKWKEGALPPAPSVGTAQEERDRREKLMPQETAAEQSEESPIGGEPVSQGHAGDSATVPHPSHVLPDLTSL